MTNVLRLDRVSYRYRERRVLHEINLDLPDGGRVVIRGPSGSGKTTLLQIMGLLRTPTTGNVWVDGESSNQWSERQRARWRNRHVGFVWQHHYLIPELTVLANVNLPCRIGKRPPSEWPGRELLDVLGLLERARDFPHQLSGGEQQRVAVGRALANRPRIVLADEPTGNLDLDSGLHIVELMLGLARDWRTSLVVVTHNPEIGSMVGGLHYELRNEGAQRIGVDVLTQKENKGESM